MKTACLAGMKARKVNQPINSPPKRNVQGDCRTTGIRRRPEETTTCSINQRQQSALRPHLRPALGLPHRRIRRHRTRPVRLHDAGRHGRRRRHARPRRRQEEHEVGRGPRPQGDRARPQGQGGDRGGARPACQRRCAGRGLSSRRDGTARARPRRRARAQSKARLRPHDRLGPGRPAGQRRRPRHQLHLDHRRARRDRHQGSAGAAAQPGRRFRRRRALSRRRRARRAAGSAEVRQGPGGRRRDVRRRGLADVVLLRHDDDRPLDRGPQPELPRRRRAFLRRL